MGEARAGEAKVVAKEADLASAARAAARAAEKEGEMVRVAGERGEVVVVGLEEVERAGALVVGEEEVERVADQVEGKGVVTRAEALGVALEEAMVVEETEGGKADEEREEAKETE